jgi:hypothetical protein
MMTAVKTIADTVGISLGDESENNKKNNKNEKTDSNSGLDVGSYDLHIIFII